MLAGRAIILGEEGTCDAPSTYAPRVAQAVVTTVPLVYPHLTTSQKVRTPPALARSCMPCGTHSSFESMLAHVSMHVLRSRAPAAGTPQRYAAGVSHPQWRASTTACRTFGPCLVRHVPVRTPACSSSPAPLQISVCSLTQPLDRGPSSHPPHPYCKPLPSVSGARSVCACVHVVHTRTHVGAGVLP